MATRPKTAGRVIPLEDKLTEGRPRKLAPPDAADVIRKVCATGSNKRGVAMALGCDITVLDRWMDEAPELKQAFDEGREKERQTLHNIVYETAISGSGKDSLLAAFYLLNSKHGYVSGQQESQANRVSVTFNIPAAQPLEQFMVLENDPTDPRTQSVSAKFIERS